MGAVVLPVVQGDWIAERRSERCQVARVRQSYADPGPGDAVLMDLVLYSFDGEKIGRESIACGGPKSFEPACEWSEERYVRIAAPDFPLRTSRWDVPVEDRPGWVTPTWTIHDLSDVPGAVRITRNEGVRSLALRTARKKQAADYRMDKVIRDRQRLDADLALWREQRAANLDLEREVTSLRRAAAELRDLARTLGVAAGQALRDRAAAIDVEIGKLLQPSPAAA